MSTDRTTTRGLDPEIQAMAAIDKTLAGLPFTARRRVLIWAIDKLNSTQFVPGGPNHPLQDVVVRDDPEV